ncbi:amino acid adenylation domain-containing protein [Laspinema olomoucense]|uniref:Amino acid adenylation domain-containing protein n=1 Tax=Laspinema olomoucense D3b TaxID=2953688 RepID=A0ABT2N465_9CYAN|nr:amino acid adenylation domain-containing protein [Laspinema sp. D3b]MCT7977448.1 amino acid adenylation domain-containing protein [Laspinema sp. D3b]
MEKRNTQHLTSFHQIFESQVQKTPEASAVVCNGQQLTYSELNQRANQLAHYLKDLGVGCEQLIGIFMERSIEIVVTILGIFKAGAAYVPLDPGYPQERLTYIAQETQFSLLLTQKHLCDRLPPSSAKISYIDSNWDTIAQYSRENLPTEILPENLAYIMYTSGSTGQPKGVQMPYINIVRYIQALSQVVTVQPEDIYLHVASFSFSSSIRQLMLPLSQGAKVLIATREQTKNPWELLNLMGQEQVTISDGVCSIWRSILEILAEEEKQGFYPSKLRLRFVVLSGENTTCALVQKIKHFLGKQIRFFNVYGQSETIGNLAYEMPPDFEGQEGHFPVGYPYPHNHCYILDENLNPIPTGEVGELMMAGGCVCRGYLNRDDLTAEKFIPNPWAERDSTSDRPLPKLFKTGDVVRQLPDGSIEVLGRTDFQVKIRGMRVELDEIATILEEHHTVRQATVVAHQKPSGENILVAYIIPEPAESYRDQSTLHHKLREFLIQKLPDYMLPAVFMEMAVFPRTPNGKLDRLALPKPSFLDNQPGDGEYSADTEIKKLFCEALNLRQVQPQDTFISLGGNSLSYIQFSMKLERYLGYLPPVWEEMTVSQLEKQEPEERKNRTIETSILLRTLAICAVVIFHASLTSIYLKGGAYLMLLIAGKNLARFNGASLLAGRLMQPFNSLLSNIIIPYVSIVWVFQVYAQILNHPEYGYWNFPVLLLVSNFLAPGKGSVFFVWFIQVLAQLIVIFLLLFSIPQIRNLANLSPWKFGLMIFGVGVFTNQIVPYFWMPAPDQPVSYYTNLCLPYMLLWLFALGWSAHFAKSKYQKVVTSIILPLPVFMWPEQQLSIQLWILVGGMIVLWKQYVSVPQILKQPIQLISSASYSIYVTHMAAFILLKNVTGIDKTDNIGSLLLHIIFALVVGVILWWGIKIIQKFLNRAIASKIKLAVE